MTGDWSKKLVNSEFEICCHSKPIILRLRLLLLILVASSGSDVDDISMVAVYNSVIMVAMTTYIHSSSPRPRQAQTTK